MTSVVLILLLFIEIFHAKVCKALGEQASGHSRVEPLSYMLVDDLVRQLTNQTLARFPLRQRRHIRLLLGNRAHFGITPKAFRRRRTDFPLLSSSVTRVNYQQQLGEETPPYRQSKAALALVSPPSSPSAMARTFDVIIYGATGFTGKLAAEYMATRYPSMRWAMAGRSLSKLESTRAELGPAAASVPLIVADARNTTAINSLVASATVIANYAGTPFIDKALPIVEACVNHGTSYVDITGELALQRSSYDKFHSAAVASNSLIIHNTGYDSIPSDLGAMMVADEMLSRYGIRCKRIRLVTREASGGISGGTLYTALAISSRGSSYPGVVEVKTRGSYSLDPNGGRAGPDKTDGASSILEWDSVAKTWVTPNIMASVNAPVVRKSNALKGYSYGEQLSYSEVAAADSLWKGIASIFGLGIGGALLAFPPTRWMLLRFVLPKPGEGPSRDQRDKGFFNADIYAVGDSHIEPVVRAHVRSGDGGDPGYKCTARMSIESALCIVLERSRCADGGVMTPATALGKCLIDRLNRSGMSLAIDPPM